MECKIECKYENIDDKVSWSLYITNGEFLNCSIGMGSYLRVQILFLIHCLKTGIKYFVPLEGNTYLYSDKNSIKIDINGQGSYISLNLLMEDYKDAFISELSKVYGELDESEIKLLTHCNKYKIIFTRKDKLPRVAKTFYNHVIYDVDDELEQKLKQNFKPNNEFTIDNYRYKINEKFVIYSTIRPKSRGHVGSFKLSNALESLENIIP